MENKKRIATTAGLVVLAVIGWIMGVTFMTPHLIQTGPQNPSEMTQLRQDLTEFIAEKLQREKSNSQLVDLSVMAPDIQANGSLRVPYLLTYTDDHEGTTSTVQATAILERMGSLWKVVRVLTEKETIGFGTKAVIAADKKSDDE